MSCDGRRTLPNDRETSSTLAPLSLSKPLWLNGMFGAELSPHHPPMCRPL